MMHWKIHFFLVTGVLCWTFAEEDWSYREEDGKLGPSEWKEQYPDCGSSNQSPISFDDAKLTEVTFEESKEKGGGYRFVDYDQTGDAHLANTGRVVHLQWVTKYGPRLVNENEEEYWLRRAIFHFPSEHKLKKDTEYILEVQLEHKNEETGKVVLLSVLFGEDACDDETDPGGMDTVVSLLKYVRNAGNYYSVDPIAPEEIVFSESPGENVCDVLQYTGSLTQPPCSSNVTWIVFKKIMCVYNSQVDQFETVLDSEEKEMWGSARPTFESTNYDVMQINC